MSFVGGHGITALTIVAGNLMALPQPNTKRLLAYSGIAHIGYMLVGFAAVSASGTAMVLFYHAALPALPGVGVDAIPGLARLLFDSFSVRV